MRIPKLTVEERKHGLAHPRIHRSGGLVVQVYGSFAHVAVTPYNHRGAKHSRTLWPSWTSAPSSAFDPWATLANNSPRLPENPMWVTLFLGCLFSALRSLPYVSSIRAHQSTSQGLPTNDPKPGTSTCLSLLP